MHSLPVLFELYPLEKLYRSLHQHLLSNNSTLIPGKFIRHFVQKFDSVHCNYLSDLLL